MEQMGVTVNYHFLYTTPSSLVLFSLTLENLKYFIRYLLFYTGIQIYMRMQEISKTMGVK